ncbi:MAG: MiaB/RimO family radical SAM methylthiotransferase, partial [Anaerotignum sp.]|nr:MiaB/RimO family radical SAM methylthiotransferase [Anaerotignum sp.]
AENGFKEVVLTGIHVASYGKDRRDTSLLEILRQVHEVEGIDRIRFSSIEPNVVTEEFAQAIADMPKVCDHFHLSLQSGCDKTLKEMNRKYDTEKYRQAAATLRKYLPEVALTTDIIAGFPGETEEDFQASYDFAKEIGFAKIHAFPYSPKRGTPAAERKDQLLNAVKSERSHRLIELSDKMADDFVQAYVGKEVEVLFERAIEDGVYEGHTTNYIKVKATSEKDLTNIICTVAVTKAENEELFGTAKA